MLRKPNLEDNLIHRRNAARNSSGDCSLSDNKDSSPGDEYQEEGNGKIKLTLMEEVFLLGLKDREGYTPLLGGSLSLGLRGCILVELALRRRITLEGAGVKRKPLFKRKVLVNNRNPTGETLLDEALKHIREEEPQSVGSWISYLSGISWNFMKHKYHMKDVRERIAKGLVEKGVLKSDRFDFYLFEISVHPLLDSSAKSNLVKKVRDAVMENWAREPSRVDQRLLSLLLLAQAADVLENAFGSVSAEDFALATKRFAELASFDPERESAKKDSTGILWAAVEYLSK